MSSIIEEYRDLIDTQNIASCFYTPSKITYNLHLMTADIETIGGMESIYQHIRETSKNNDRKMKSAINFNCADYKLKIGQVKHEREQVMSVIIKRCRTEYGNLDCNVEHTVREIYKFVAQLTKGQSNYNMLVLKSDEETLRKLFYPVLEFRRNEILKREEERRQEQQQRLAIQLLSEQVKMTETTNIEEIKSKVASLQGTLWDEEDNEL